MLRFDQCVCGTSTTGTGTLTLAATPTPPGGADFDVVARAGGGANSAVIPVDYTIIEYTDSTFTTAKASEQGYGTLTLGGSSGIANCTLARTTVVLSQTSLNSQPASQGTSAITIGTAANVLVMCTPAAFRSRLGIPYFDTTGDNVGVGPLRPGVISGSSFAMPATATAVFWVEEWPWAKTLTQASVRIQTAAGAGASTCAVAVFAIASTGKPGRRLINFGDTGSLANTAGTINTSSALGTGIFLPPGFYYYGILPVYVSGAPALRSLNTQSMPTATGVMGSGSMLPYNRATVATGDLNDPPTTTGWTQIQTVFDIPWIAFK